MNSLSNREYAMLMRDPESVYLNRYLLMWCIHFSKKGKAPLIQKAKRRPGPKPKDDYVERLMATILRGASERGGDLGEEEWFRAKQIGIGEILHPLVSHLFPFLNESEDESDPEED